MFLKITESLFQEIEQTAMKLNILSFVRIVGTIFLVLYGAIVVPLLYEILQTGTTLGEFEMNIMLPFVLVLAAVILLVLYVKRQKAKQNIPPFYATLSVPFNQAIKWIALAVPVVLLPMLLLGLNFLINGSMEMYPSEERQDTARLVGFLLTYFWSALAVTCLCLFLKISAYIRRQKAPDA